MAEYQNTFRRAEIKYMLDSTQYTELMKELTERGIAKVDAYGRTNVLNIYYDTPDYRLIRASLDSKAYKEKLRLRCYKTPDSDSTVSFIEIKKKYDGIVYKRRTSAEYGGAREYLNNGTPLSEDTRDSQIRSEIDYFLRFYKDLAPAMVITYERIAMEGLSDKNLRITFDDNILWRTGNLDLKYGPSGKALLKPGQHLMEIKIAGAIPFELSGILDRLGIRKCSFSKYGKAFLSMKKQSFLSGLAEMDENSQKERSAA